MSEKSSIKSYREVRDTVISLAVMFIVTVLFGIGTATLFTGNVVEYSKSDVWNDAFKTVEKARVGIQFNEVSTTVDQYDTIREACLKHINDVGTVDMHVPVDVTSNIEDVYTDNISDNTVSLTSVKGNKIKDSTGKAVETGPVYFDDMLMLRFVNYDGELKVITGRIDDNNIDIFDQSKFSNYVIKEGSDIVTGNEFNKIDAKRSISEDEYSSIVVGCVTQLLKASNNDEKDVALNYALNYFTNSGKDSVIGVKNAFNINSNTKITCNAVLCGKSDTSTNIKDRVYVQFKMSESGESRDLNLIIKLNSKLRIFDVDCI